MTHKGDLMQTAALEQTLRATEAEATLTQLIAACLHDAARYEQEGANDAALRAELAAYALTEALEELRRINE